MTKYVSQQDGFVIGVVNLNWVNGYQTGLYLHLGSNVWVPEISFL